MFVYLVTFVLLLLFSSANLLGVRPSVLPAQMIFIVFGVLLFYGIRKIGVPFFRMNSKVFYILFVILLFITFLIGIEVKGSQRWIDIGFTRFQPSEFFKFFYILYFANVLSRGKKSLKPFSLLITSVIAFVIPTLIIFKQPDLGNAMVFTYMFAVMILFAGIPIRYIFSIGIIVALLLPLLWFSLHGYQRDRVLSFFVPHADRQGTSYNMTQALITVGSGSFIGRGLGTGTQSRLAFLPENHTDFAFSSLVEQFGLVGGIAVLGLMNFIAIRLIRTMIRLIKQDDDQSRFLFLYVLGVFSCFMFHIAVNAGMNLGLVPVTGITLPFISYGGSSLVSWFMMFALVPDLK